MIGAPAHTPGRSFRCVLLHPRSRPPRPELMAALARPSFRIFHCDNEFAALAHLCAREGDPAPRADEGTILLLVEPGDLDAPVELVDALDRYVPGASIWIYDSRATPRLKALDPEDLTTWRVERAHVEPPRPPTPAPISAPRAPQTPPARDLTPRLRLAGEGTLPAEVSPVQVVGPGVPDPVPDVKPKAQPPAAEAPYQPPQPVSSVTPAPTVAPVRPIHTLLSDEELAMLLSGEPEKRT